MTDLRCPWCQGEEWKIMWSGNGRWAQMECQVCGAETPQASLFRFSGYTPREICEAKAREWLAKAEQEKEQLRQSLLAVAEEWERGNGLIADLRRQEEE